MKKTLLAIIAATSLLVSCGDTNKNEGHETDSTTTEQPTYMEEQSLEEAFPISVAVPEGWEMAEDKDFGVLHILSPTNEGDNFQEMVNVVVGGTKGKELDEFFDLNLEMIQGMFEELYQTEKPSFETIRGIEFKKVRYNYVFEGLPLTAQLYVTIKDEKSFIINCSALQNTFDTYAAQFANIVQSIEIK